MSFILLTSFLIVCILGTEYAYWAEAHNKSFTKTTLYLPVKAFITRESPLKEICHFMLLYIYLWIIVASEIPIQDYTDLMWLIPVLFVFASLLVDTTLSVIIKNNYSLLIVQSVESIIVLLLCYYFFF
ncbi:hypothetical protein [Flavobacterium alkalisoli]|uniref:hypothetical protein n=1 Tax=Flavobacterium alkalisoli TaxID=2602769 RepID=UPI003A90C2BF